MVVTDKASIISSTKLLYQNYLSRHWNHYVNFLMFIRLWWEKKPSI